MILYKLSSRKGNQINECMVSLKTNSRKTNFHHNIPYQKLLTSQYSFLHIARSKKLAYCIIMKKVGQIGSLSIGFWLVEHSSISLNACIWMTMHKEERHKNFQMYSTEQFS